MLKKMSLTQLYKTYQNSTYDSGQYRKISKTLKSPSSTWAFYLLGLFELFDECRINQPIYILFSFINTVFDVKFIDVIARAINRVKAFRFSKYFLLALISNRCVPLTINSYCFGSTPERFAIILTASAWVAGSLIYLTVLSHT